MNIFHDIGGEAAISAAVEIFYDKTTHDPCVAEFFEGIDLAKLRDKQVSFLSMALGGPNPYEGKSLVDAHADLGITHAQFDIVCEHLRQTLLLISVAEAVVNKIMTTIEGTRHEIVSSEQPGAQH